MDLNHLSIFVAVADAGNFTLAGARLGLPKSTISRGISALEATLGVRLLHRTTRQVTLSTAGAAFYARISPMVKSLETSIKAMPELEDQPSGDLRITASVDFGTSILADLVTRFRLRYPAVRVDVRLTNQVLDLVAEGIDLAMRISTGNTLKDSNLMARKASRIDLHLFASPLYLARRGTPETVTDLTAHDWVGYRGVRMQLEGPDGTNAVGVEGRILCDEMSFLHAALRAGAGIGALPTFLAQRDLITGELVRVLPEWRTPSGVLWLVWPGAQNMPRKVTAFRDFVLDALKARPLMLEAD